MVDVTTWHEHSFGAKLDLLDAYRASWGGLVLAVLFRDFYYR